MPDDAPKFNTLKKEFIFLRRNFMEAYQTKTIMKILALILSAVVLFSACKKKDNIVGGKGGNATVNVYPQHHEVAKNLIGMKVYIKYNSSDAPANGIYDDSVACTNHYSLSSCTCTSLNNGNYYFYAYGYDTSIAQNVHGGSPYTITQQSSQNFNLPVSE